MCTTTVYAFDIFRLDPVDRVLTREGRAVRLTPKALYVLTMLVERAGELVEKAELMAAVWGDAYVEEGILAQNIYQIRQTLGPSAKGMIETVPRRGYRFATEVRRVAGVQSGVRAVAALPFDALGFGAENRIVGLAMADAIITELGGRTDLVVRPVSSGSVTDTKAGRSAVSAGRALGVGTLITGTLQHTAGKLRATVQVLSVRRNVPIWTARFDCADDDLLALEDMVCAALGSQLVPASDERRNTVQHRRARDHRLRGRFFWNKRTAEGLRKAIACFTRAIEIDPSYARAHAGLADALALLPLFGCARPRDAFPRAASAAERALALDDSLAEAHTSLAYTRFLFDWDWSAARRGFDRALSLDPNYPTAHHWLGFLCSARGRHDEAVRFATRAAELDPLSLVIRTDLALVLYTAGRHDDAVRQLAKTIDLEPSFAYAHFARALVLAELGRASTAERSAARARSLAPDNPAMAAVHAHALARAGDHRAARKVLEAGLRGEHAKPAHRALVLTGLGAIDAAVDELERACAERSRFVVFLAVWPVWKPLHASPRFQALIDRLGLATAAP